MAGLRWVLGRQRRAVADSSRRRLGARLAVCAPPRAAALLTAAAALLAARSAAARATGIVAEGCSGCHGGATATLAMTASPSTFAPGDVVTMTLTIQGPGIKDGGVYLSDGGIGTLMPISGEGLAANSIDGLTHTAPKPAAGGQVTFRFNWQAPNTPGGISIWAYAVAGNGNNAPSGDATGSQQFGWTFGCAGQEYYWDGDGDGYGTRTLTRMGCTSGPPTGFAAKDGDCDDTDPAVHPGVAEVCNGKDDDCNGQVDENAPAVMLWPDPDGDGYYAVQTGTPRMGCAGIQGYAAVPGDCAPNDPTVHPNAKEICNGHDDNCDGRIDEYVRPRCGTGWCQRESQTCDPKDCIPGPPHPETCNFVDDDCDGEIDNGPICGADLQCTKGECVPATSAGSEGTGSTGTGIGTGTGTGIGSSTGVAGSGGASANNGESGGHHGGCRTSGSPASNWTSVLLAFAALRLRRRRTRR